MTSWPWEHGRREHLDNSYWFWNKVVVSGGLIVQLCNEGGAGGEGKNTKYKPKYMTVSVGIWQGGLNRDRVI